MINLLFPIDTILEGLLLNLLLYVVLANDINGGLLKKALKTISMNQVNFFLSLVFALPRRILSRL